MADFVATAFVRIQSELDKGFRVSLAKQISTAVGKGFTVEVTPVLTPFKQALQTQLSESIFKVYVTPTIRAPAAAKAKLQTEIAALSEGLVVPIKVLPQKGAVGAATAAPGIGAAAAGAATTSAELGKLDAQTEETAASTKKLAGADKQLATEEATLASLTRSRARAQQLLQLSLRETLGIEFQERQIKAGLREVETGLRTGIAQEAAAREAGNVTLADEIAKRQALIATVGEELAAKEGALALSVEQSALSKAVAASTTEANVALSKNVQQISSRSALAHLNNDLLRIESDLHDLNARALAAEETQLAADTEALLTNVRARQADIEKQRAQLASSAKLRSQAAAAGRGGVATFLSALGARGATLAAGGEFLAGAAAVAITGKAISSAAELEKQLNILRITARATHSEMEAVGEASIDLGRDISLPGVSAGDAARTMTQLVRAGLSVEDAIDGAKGTLQLATAAEIDFEQASSLVASALNAFSLSGTDAVHVADLLTNAANESQAEITDVGISLQQAAGAASLVGVSLDDTVSLLTLLSRAGLKGSDAGTSLRTAFIKLINPTKRASAVLDQLNIRIRDSQGNIRPEVFAEFEQATNRLTRAEHDRAAAVVFGTDAIRTQALVGRQGVRGLNEVQDALAREGSAAELAGAQAAGFSGKISALASNLETLGTILGGVSLGPLKIFVDTINEAVSDINTVLLFTSKLKGGIKDAADEAEEGHPKVKKFFDVAKKGAIELAKQGIDPTRRTRLLGRFVTHDLQRAGVLPRKDVEGFGEAAAKARIEVAALLRTIGQGPLGTSGQRELNAALVGLDKMADKLEHGDAAAQAVARSIRELIADIKKTGQVPSVVEIEAKLDPQKARLQGKTASEKILEGIRSAAPDFVETGLFLIDLVGQGMDKGVKKLDLGAKFKTTLDTALAVAQAAGDENEELRILREQRARAQRQLERQQKLFDEDPSKGRDEAVRNAAARVTEKDDAIDQILERRKSDAEAAKRDAEKKQQDIEDAQKEADQAILDIFSSNRQKAQNKLTIAQASEGVDDDIKTTQFLKRLVTLQIQRVKERIKTVELRKAALQELTQTLFNLNRDLVQLRQQRRQTLREQVREGLELDVEFFQTTENIKGETRARKRLIANLAAELHELAAIKKKTIEQKNRMKELRNEIAEQRKAIQDITQERKKMFAELSFAFLTTQQGFAANLLGNLLPLGSIAGTLGGSSPTGATGLAGTAGTSGTSTFPGALLPQEHGRGRVFGAPGDAVEEKSRQAQAGATGGFTAAQASNLLHLTRQMVQLLASLDGRGKHPEHKNSRRRGGAAHDVAE